MADRRNCCGHASGSICRDVDVPPAVAPLLDRRVTRRYTDQPVPDSLLDALAGRGAVGADQVRPAAILRRGDARRARGSSRSPTGSARWTGSPSAPVFLVWCGDMRRNQRLCEQHDMPHANNNLDTFLNTAVDCSLAMAQFIAAADAVGLGTCPISYVRSHIERVTPLLVAAARVSTLYRASPSAGRCSAARFRCACRHPSWCIANATTTRDRTPRSAPTTNDATRANRSRRQP